MEIKHTPGPWKTPNPIADNSGTFGAMVFSVYADNGTHIYDKRIINKHVDEHKANARLISAAPDMFEVIKELYDFSIKTELRGAIFPKLEAAYLKATGQPHSL
jgi:hypothetical protein